MSESSDDLATNRLAELVASNERRIEALRLQGIGLDQGSIDRMRLAWLCDTLLPSDSSDRVNFELGLQGAYAEQLDQTEAQVRVARLTAGVNLHVPKPGSN